MQLELAGHPGESCPSQDTSQKVELPPDDQEGEAGGVHELVRFDEPVEAPGCKKLSLA